MSKDKTFQDGDKVFAKVKGYPPWPAKITKRNDKKYEVLFYGTNEIGIIKAEDICLYVENKATILKKPITRKFYPEAVKEIEEALKKDGAVLSEDTNVTSTRRKRSSSYISDAENEVETSKVEKKKVGGKLKKSNNANNTLDSFLVKKKRESVEDTKQSVNIGEIDIISQDYLKHIIDFAAEVKNKQEHYEKKLLKSSKTEVMKVVPSKLPSGVFAGIKYNPGESSNEFEQTELESKEAKKVLDILKKLEDGVMTPEDEPDNVFPDINKTEEDIKEDLMSKISNRKSEMLKWLTIESKMVSLDTKIRLALNMQKGEPQKALEHMKTLKELDLKPVMLKKHPQLVETVKRLRKYVGNIKEWKFTAEEESQFQVDAEEVRSFAVGLYEHFRNLFGATDTETFWDFFQKKVEEFKDNCKKLSDSEIYGLCAEPDSKQAFMDLSMNDNIQNTKSNSAQENLEVSDLANGNKILDGKAISSST